MITQKERMKALDALDYLSLINLKVKDPLYLKALETLKEIIFE